jgi:hypothetical protein
MSSYQLDIEHSPPLAQILTPHADLLPVIQFCSFSLRESTGTVDTDREFRFSRTLGDPGPPTRAAPLVLQGILSHSGPEKCCLHRKCVRIGIQSHLLSGRRSHLPRASEVLRDRRTRRRCSSRCEMRGVRWDPRCHRLLKRRNPGPARQVPRVGSRRRLASGGALYRPPCRSRGPPCRIECQATEYKTAPFSSSPVFGRWTITNQDLLVSGFKDALLM